MATRPKHLNHSDEELALMPPESMNFDEREYVASKPDQYWVDVIARIEQRENVSQQQRITHLERDRALLLAYARANEDTARTDMSDDGWAAMDRFIQARRAVIDAGLLESDA